MMSDQLIGQLISAGSGVIMALAFLAVMWRLPVVLSGIKDILQQIFDAAEGGADRLVAANESLTEASKVMRDAMREAIEAKTQMESKVSELIARLSQIERELETERKKRETLEQELGDERKARQEDRELSQKQLEAHTARIRVLEDQLAAKDRVIEELRKERTQLLERVEALEKAQKPTDAPAEQPKAA